MFYIDSIFFEDNLFGFINPKNSRQRIYFKIFIGLNNLTKSIQNYFSSSNILALDYHLTPLINGQKPGSTFFAGEMAGLRYQPHQDMGRHPLDFSYFAAGANIAPP